MCYLRVFCALYVVPLCLCNVLRVFYDVLLYILCCTIESMKYYYTLHVVLLYLWCGVVRLTRGGLVSEQSAEGGGDADGARDV